METSSSSKSFFWQSGSVWLTTSRRRRLLRIVAVAAMIVYSAFTLFPFYTLLVRSFVPTKESTNLHLWPPETEEISMDMQIGNLMAFYDMDGNVFKRDMGIPLTEFLGSRMTLRQVIEKYEADYGVTEEKVRGYFAGFYRYNGWLTLLRADTGFLEALIRTLLITTASVAGVTILSLFTGYGLAGLRRKDQMFIYNLYLLQTVIPSMLILLPQYQLFQWVFGLFPDFDVQGSLTRRALQLLALVLINIKGTALGTMMYTSAISAVPQEIEDSARVDGATPLQYLRHILVPLLRVPIVGVIVIQLPLVYNQFLEPYVYLDRSSTAMLPLIQNLSGQFSTNFQVIYAAVLASIVPLVIVYVLFRRFFVAGVMTGAVKG